MLILSLAAACSWWAAFPPLAFRPAAWLPPVFWAVILHDRLAEPDGSGRATWFKIWGAGYCCWLGLLHWMCYPAAWTVLVWMVMSGVMAAFFVAFLHLTETVVRHGAPLPVSMAVVWTGIEWFRRTCFLGGFPFAALEHSQFRNTAVIQLAGIAGEYSVGSLMVLTGAFVGQAISGPHSSNLPSIRCWRICRAGCALAIVTLLVGFGHRQMRDSSHPKVLPTDSRTVALLQSATNLVGIDSPPDFESAFNECVALAQRCGPDVDLVVWPETVCPIGWDQIHQGYVPQELRGIPRGRIEEMIQTARSDCARPLVELARECRSTLLLNVRVRDFDRHGPCSLPTNSVLLVDRDQGIRARYDKSKLALFLEYNPIPSLWGSDMFGPPGFRFGAIEQAVAFPICPKNGFENKATSSIEESEEEPFVAAVSICFESMFPEVIRHQVAVLRDEGFSVDALINVSNDADHSRLAAIDMHLATHVFRAVENGIQYLVASNCGISAWIDRTGRILAEGNSGQAECIVVKINRDRGSTIYARLGNIWPQACADMTAIFIALRLLKCLIGWGRRIISSVNDNNGRL